MLPSLVHLASSLVQPDPPARGDMAGGIWSAPAWVIGGLGAVIAIGAVLAVVLRVVYLRRKDREDASPRSRRRW